MKSLVRSALLLLCLCAARPALAQEQVLLSTAQAVREVFPAAAGIAPRPWRPSPAEREAVARRTGQPGGGAEYPFLLVYDGQRRFLGYALVAEERGKYRPITFLVGIAPDMQVRDVAVMVYRESRGGEVKQGRFLRQFRGKGLRDPIRANRDIVNISGATISVHSMNTGVRRALAAAEMAFGREPPALAAAALRPLSALR